MIEKPVSFNSLTFNTQSDSVLTNSPHYWIKLDTVDGLYGDEIRYESHPIPGDHGERSGDALRSGKQLVLSGRVFAWNLSYLRIAQRALAAAFWDLAAHNLTFYDWADGNSAIQLYFTCRVNQPLVITDAIEDDKHFRCNWTVGLRADNPRSKKVSDNSVYPTYQS